MANLNDFGFPFESITGDRQYASAEWREYFAKIYTDGVLENDLNELKVMPQTVADKTVYVDTGSVLIKGAVRAITATQTIAIADNVSGNPRIDRIVARLTISGRKIEFGVLQGTPAASPSAPALTQTAATWEISLAKIAVANGFSTIVAGNITDERVYCQTLYMQTFDDENNLLKYNRDVTVVDAGGAVTEVQYKRPADSTLFLKRNYTNADANGRYQTVTELFYLANGSTVYKTVVYTLVYFSNGVVDTMTRVVS